MRGRLGRLKTFFEVCEFNRKLAGFVSLVKDDCGIIKLWRNSAGFG